MWDVMWDVICVCVLQPTVCTPPHMYIHTLHARTHTTHTYTHTTHTTRVYTHTTHKHSKQIWGSCIASANSPIAQVEVGIQRWLDLGVLPHKLILGLPWYEGGVVVDIGVYRCMPSMYTCMHVFTSVCIPMCVLLMCVSTYVCVYLCVCIPMCVYAYVCLYMHIYTTHITSGMGTCTPV